MGFSRQEYWSGVPLPSLHRIIVKSNLNFSVSFRLWFPSYSWELDILVCKVKWALGNITTNKASGSDGIPAELIQILKDDVVKVLHSTS